MRSPKLERSFYAQDDVVQIAKDLLGTTLCTVVDGQFSSGLIVETEAYRGVNDRGSHSCIHGLTNRTKVIFDEPGHAYVYTSYGIHDMFNVVTAMKGTANAILVRAIQPLEGIEIQLSRRNQTKLQRSTGGGPGILCQALGIKKELHYGTDLLGEEIWIEQRNDAQNHLEIIESSRVGLGNIGKDAELPWRFRIDNNGFTSPAK